MGYCAQEHVGRLTPILNLHTVTQHPNATRHDALEHAQHLRPLSVEALPQLAGITLRVPALDVTIGMKDRDEIVELATPQRIVNEMGARPGPEHDVGTPQVLRHVILLEHGAIGDVAGY